MKRKVSVILVICIMISLCMGNNTSMAATKSLKNRSEVVSYLSSQMVNRSSKVEFLYTGSDYKSICSNLKGLLNSIGSKDSTSTSTDGDYLLAILKHINCSYRKVNEKVTFTFTIQYYETKKQTDALDKKIPSILKSIGVNGKGKNPYQKVKLIHDYISKQVKYDNSYKKYSAYQALVNHSSVCNGYATLMYKMLLAAGIPCKYVSGKGYSNGTVGAHAWNMVKLGSKWYNIDVTWDDPDKGSRIYYDYFLKGSTAYNKTHAADSYYKIDSFVKKFPVSKTDYNSKNAKNDLTVTLSDINVSFTKKTLKVGQTATLSLKTPAIYSKDDIKTVTYTSKNKSIAKVTSAGKITAIKKGTVKIMTKVTLLNGKNKTYTTVVSVK